MKKRTREQLQRELLAGLKRHRRYLARKETPSVPGRSLRNSHNHSIFHGYRSIDAPELLSIYNISKEDGSLYTQAIDFYDQIRRYVGQEKCVISFKNTQVISAAAIVVIYAAIEESLQKGTARATIEWSGSNSAVVVNKQLRNINIHLLIQRKQITYSFRNSQSMPIVRGTSNQYVDDIIDYVQQFIYENEMSPEEEYIFADAVTEAINNVGLHAYPDTDAQDRNWWLMCDVKDGQLFLAIYDTGVGIPATVLEKKWFWASLKAFYPEEYNELIKLIPGFESSGLKFVVPQKLKDAQMIYLSMQGDVTGTRRSKHGQGSKSIRALVDDTEDGKLWIFSHKGLYTYPAEDNETGLYKLPKQLPGTLVQWNIKLS
ncbi:hypothetical protein [Marinobacterium stanieri]|uniref:Histidine kinase-like ATPase domain-containing protein n=1 Tax=Marinobacterium stanieri TaxID=49186 RepID=A0A1N6QCK8_9GAMM|nr:hypothetical protein [Marinobacterium stanieri]SIQ14319.1 hypothetical protein SAMN05421647_102418 [Marinobacterium stanieri]